MKPLDWLRAQRSGQIKHDWNPIHIEGGGHVLDLMVSTDAAEVNGFRENIGARGQQLLADALGARLPTAKILAERHRQAAVKLRPITGDITHLTAEQHSALVDKALYLAQGTAGAWIVSDVGKSWTIDRLSSPTVAIAEGFFLDGDNAHDIFGPAAAPGVLAVRVAGFPEVRAGKHNLIQGDGAGNLPTDYSQKALFVLDACTLDGAPASLGDIYADAELCGLVSPDGKPLPARHPGVEALEDSTEWRALLAEDEAHAPDTQPASTTERLPAIKTPPGLVEMYAEMRTATAELERAGTLALMSQWWGETGGGRFMWCNNVGNFKAKAGGATDWCFFTCNELLPHATAVQAIATAPAREPLTDEQIAWFKKRTGIALDPAGGSSAIAAGQQAGLDVVWFLPPHPYACFAAFRTLREGVQWYVGKMRTRFAKAWPAVVAGDVAAFGHLLKLAGYYTDTEAHYVGGLLANFAFLDKQLASLR